MTTDRKWATRLAVALLAIASAGPLSSRAEAQRIETAKAQMDWGRASFILFDELDYIPGSPGRPVSFEGIGWYGGAYNRLWFRTEGEQETASSNGEGEVHLLAGRLISPFWDAVTGVRYDRNWSDRKDGRTLFVLGLVGEAPLRFELEPSIFISTRGDFSARLDASYQFLITQRVVFEPSLDLDAAARAIPEFGVGTGLNSMVLAGRLRYEIRRKVGPYVGVGWNKKFGSTADLARIEGRDASAVNVLIGLRVWR